MAIIEKQTSCRQCGTCCTNGGPALHNEDIVLLRQGIISRQHLITIRKGELAHNPITDTIQETNEELVKLKGTEGTWTCCYFDSQLKSCRVYSSRPLACRTLKCWDTEESLALVETDLLNRMQILEEHPDLAELVTVHETLCPLPHFSGLTRSLQEKGKNYIEALEKLINDDLHFRNTIIREFETAMNEELFLFGRPLFQLLQAFSLNVYQDGNRLRLQSVSPKKR